MGKDMMSPDDFRKGLAQSAVEESAREKSGGDITWLSTKDGKFALGDSKLPDEIPVIVLGYIFENAAYDSTIKWDPKNPQPPICFALDVDEDEMVPHDDSPDPQHDDCLSCELNEFGSDPDGGNGKACKNRRRLVLMDPDDGDLMMVRIPPTGIKNWRQHLKRLNNDHGLPPHGAVTTIFFDEENSKVLDYEITDTDLSDDTITLIIEHMSEATEMLKTPINCEEREEKPEPAKKSRKKKAVAKKAVSKKSTAKASGKKKVVRRRV